MTPEEIAALLQQKQEELLEEIGQRMEDLSPKDQEWVRQSAAAMVLLDAFDKGFKEAKEDLKKK